MDNSVVLSETRDWLEKLVIGLNLCPFAAAPFSGDRIRFSICTESDETSVYRAILEEMDTICNQPSAQVETSLLILSNPDIDFDTLLDIAGLAEQLVEEAGMEQILQIASFHPDYCFDGVPADDPANYSNRSPYPMLHFIRADELESVVSKHPDPDGIPERNIELLREMGTEKIKAMLDKPAD